MRVQLLLCSSKRWLLHVSVLSERDARCRLTQVEINVAHLRSNEIHVLHTPVISPYMVNQHALYNYICHIAHHIDEVHVGG